MKQPRAWQRMLSGRRLDLLDPTPMDIEIADIAHGLAFVARWNGQTRGDHAYSVAEHSLLVETLFVRIDPAAPAKWRLAALLHDAPEYVIGDMISPVKSAVGRDTARWTDRLAAAVHLRFGLPAVLPAHVKRRIKQADRVSAWDGGGQHRRVFHRRGRPPLHPPGSGADRRAVHRAAPAAWTPAPRLPPATPA